MRKSEKISFGNNRVFLNDGDEICTSCVAWHVEVEVTKNKKQQRAWLNAGVETQDTKAWWLSSEEDLRPMYKYRQELTKFLYAFESAMGYLDAEGYEFNEKEHCYVRSS